MQKLRENVKMMSINQMNIYHTLLEAFNVIRNSSSSNVRLKWSHKPENNYFLRSETKNDQTVPIKPKKSCIGFTYTAAKLYNKLPCDIKETRNPKLFKSLTKAWIWKNIPAY